MTYVEPKPLTEAGVVVVNDGTDEPSWLAARRGKYTATTVTAIAGSNPYTKLIDVWNDFTDPDYDPAELRNRWLDERAAFGQEREPEIVKWASADPRTGGNDNPFMPTRALVGLPELVELDRVSTPDAYKFARDGVLVLLECKASQQNWEVDGIPQHVYDQIQWQIYTTGAVRVWLAQELVKWVGRGATKRAEVVGTWLTPVEPDARRLEFLLGKLAWFDGLLKAGIAPESDIDLREIAAQELDPFDADEQALADWEEAQATIARLDEIAAIDERLAADTKRRLVLVDEVKATIKQYEGRRVHLIGRRFIAKLVRGTRKVENTKSLPGDTLRAITTWVESETVKFEPNPEYVAPEPEVDASTHESE